MLDVSTTRVAYVKVTPTSSNWIQPIAIESTSRCGSDGSRSNPPRDVDRTDRDPIAIELQVWTALRLDRDRIAIQLPVWTGLKFSRRPSSLVYMCTLACPRGQFLHMACRREWQHVSVFAIVGCMTCFILLFPSREVRACRRRCLMHDLRSSCFLIGWPLPCVWIK